jgi:GNAT superfamily N-acetyltransferase
MHIRTLTASDTRPYRELMLDAYTRAADAFTSTAEERAREPESWWTTRIGGPQGLAVSFGADLNGALVGTVALEFASKPKTKHSALLLGMYVREPARRLGVGRALLQAALADVGADPCALNAQTYLIDMYARHGFVVDGDEFCEDGIPHVPMLRMQPS